jgi:hypothetical protein
MRMPFAALLIATAAAGLPALAQDTAPGPITAAEDVKVNQLIVYGSDPCPVSTEDEITVCARRPEDDRYRIPEPLRDDPNDPQSNSWVVRAEALEYVGRTGIGSCTPVGPGGGIGCFQQLVRQARAERATSDEVNWTRLVEEARQERLGRIDEESERLEQEIREREAATP